MRNFRPFLYSLSTGLCLCFYVCASGADAAPVSANPDYDKQLAIQLRIIENGDTGEGQDKIGQASDRIKAMLVKWADQPALMSAPLKMAKAAGLDVHESKDHNLRIYNWFTRNGGTMQVNDNVMQYKAAAKTYGKPHKGEQTDDEVNYTGIESLRTTGGETMYLLLSEMIGSNIDYSTSVRAVAVRGKELQDIKVFKTKKTLLSEIKCDTNRDTTKNAEGNLVGIEYDKATRIIKVPLVNKDMTFDEKYLRYKFDGQKFNYTGSGTGK